MKEKVDSKTLRSAQFKMLDILISVDEICKRNDISYWLDGGTLLGAVRHKGFIPWDDDIDICMTRQDFNKFIKLTSDQFPSDLFLQTPKTDNFYFKRTLPCKVRLNNTKVIEADDLQMPSDFDKSHRGLFVDIFPVDYYSKNKIFRHVFERLLVRIYYLKTISVYIDHNSQVRRVLSKLANIFPWYVLDYLIEKQSKLMNRKSSRSNRILGFGIEVPAELGFMSDKLLYPLKNIEFEGRKFPAPSSLDEWLTIRYGSDYMELPDEEKRVWHAIDIKL
ncbi:LicD family protein [Vibrio splendidus]|uniref:LicD family protein n=1 Tax=Vibrio splendidus TaxID=29497 RepID=UPI00076A0982|nr:LicD family protein [Vibrio splendidus]